MTIRTKYVIGMNEIKADQRLKQAIFNKAASGALHRTEPRPVINKVAMIAFSCLIILVLAIGVPQVLRHEDNRAIQSTLFGGFVLTAYAANGAPIAVKPDVEFPLGQYSMFMSSVPGFPVTIASKDADKIEVRASEGQLLLWNTADSKVKPQGNEATMKSGETIYWSPLVESDASAATEGILEITAYKEMKKLGSSKIEIKSKNHVLYKGKLTNE